MTRHISEDLLFRMAAEPVTDAGQRQVRLAQLARTLHKLYETTEQDIELFRTLQHTRIRFDVFAPHIGIEREPDARDVRVEIASVHREL